MRLDSLGQAGYIAHAPTLKAMSGLLAVRYEKLPIVLLYNVSSTLFPNSSLFRFVLVAIWDRILYDKLDT